MNVYHSTFAVSLAPVVKPILSTVIDLTVYFSAGVNVITTASAPCSTVCVSGATSPFSHSTLAVIVYSFIFHCAVNIFSVQELTLSTHTVAHPE